MSLPEEIENQVIAFHGTPGDYLRRLKAEKVNQIVFDPIITQIKEIIINEIKIRILNKRIPFQYVYHYVFNINRYNKDIAKFNYYTFCEMLVLNLEQSGLNATFIDLSKIKDYEPIVVRDNNLFTKLGDACLLIKI